MRTTVLSLSLAILGFILGSPGKADTFGSGVDAFEIEFVPIGAPGNLPYSVANPAGAVDYRYRMGKYEISEQMIDKANTLGGLGITKDTRGPDKPATSVSWYEAARFVNWLNTSTGNQAAYKFIGNDFVLWDPNDPGYNPNNLYRNKLAKYVLPSLDEWHKAAYYDPMPGVWYDYPTGTNSVPDGIDFVGDTEFDAVFRDPAADSQPNDITNVGLLSPFGTAGQGGNVAEWEESAFDRMNEDANEQRRSPGGAWVSSPNLMGASNTGIGTAPQFQSPVIGFRVAAIPEPCTLLIAVFAIFEVQILRRTMKTRAFK